WRRREGSGRSHGDRRGHHDHDRRAEREHRDDADGGAPTRLDEIDGSRGRKAGNRGARMRRVERMEGDGRPDRNGSRERRWWWRDRRWWWWWDRRWDGPHRCWRGRD